MATIDEWITIEEYVQIPDDGRRTDVPPQIVIEVRSMIDRRKELREKVAKYLAIGVITVCVIDPELQNAWL